jgi:hypothetical protein
MPFVSFFLMCLFLLYPQFLRDSSKIQQNSPNVFDTGSKNFIELIEQWVSTQTTRTGSQYNSVTNNNVANLSIDFCALRDIKKDEEITINYHGDPEDDSSLWFDVIK